MFEVTRQPPTEGGLSEPIARRRLQGRIPQDAENCLPNCRLSANSAAICLL